MPQNVTFDSGDTSESFTFTAEPDTVDDDGESVKLSFGASLPAGVSAVTPATSTVTITDDDVPSVTVSFGSDAYTVAESDDPGTPGVTENTVEVTLTLSADPERTVVIPIAKSIQDGASTADYSGVPQHVTFDSGDTSRSFTFTAAHDTVDDDGERVQLSFGATLPDGVSSRTPATSTVTITDDDVPSVTVSFGSDAYTVAESDDSDTTNVTENTVEVTLTLSADPERTVVIPIEKTNQGGATTADYSGVPQNVTFDSGDTQKSFVFTAETDTDDDHGESVRLSFDTMPDARVSEGSPSEAMVTIRQDSTQSTADCNSAIWCADLEFRSESPPGEMWFLGSTFVDSQFHYGGVTYRFGHISVAPYGHNIPINGQPNPPWAIPERTKFYFSLHNMNASGYDLDRFRVPNDDWMDWTLHISTTKNGETLTAVLPFSEARFGGGQSEWRWYGSDLEALRAAWTEGQVYKLKIVEDPRSQRTPKVLGPPLYLKVTPYTNHTLGAWWKMPENRVDSRSAQHYLQGAMERSQRQLGQPCRRLRGNRLAVPRHKRNPVPLHSGPYRRRRIPRARDCNQHRRRQRAFGGGQWYANAPAGNGPEHRSKLTGQGCAEHRRNPGGGADAVGRYHGHYGRRRTPRRRFQLPVAGRRRGNLRSRWRDLHPHLRRPG